MSLLSQGTLGKIRISGYLKGNGESALGLSPHPVVVCFLFSSPPFNYSSPLPDSWMWMRDVENEKEKFQRKILFLDSFTYSCVVYNILFSLACWPYLLCFKIPLFMRHLHAFLKKISENTVNANTDDTDFIKVCLQETLYVII